MAVSADVPRFSGRDEELASKLFNIERSAVAGCNVRPGCAVGLAVVGVVDSILGHVARANLARFDGRSTPSVESAFKGIVLAGGEEEGVLPEKLIWGTGLSGECSGEFVGRPYIAAIYRLISIYISRLKAQVLLRVDGQLLAVL